MQVVRRCCANLAVAATGLAQLSMVLIYHLFHSIVDVAIISSAFNKSEEHDVQCVLVWRSLQSQ